MLFFFLGVFIGRGGKEDVLLTKNFAVGESVYGEKRISVEVGAVVCGGMLSVVSK